MNKLFRDHFVLLFFFRIILIIFKEGMILFLF